MKRDLGPNLCLYPMPVTIVGANVDGRPNYLAVAHVGILNFSTPQYISIGLRSTHHTVRGIQENGTFSVNIPSEDEVVEVDHSGMVSGRKED